MIYGTWNVQGLSRKTNEVVAELQNARVDIGVITETKRKGKGSENWGYYDHFYSGVSKDQRAQQGVSILIRRNLRKYVTTWEAISPRLIKLNLTLKGHRMVILGVYGINDDSPVNVKEEFFEQLNDEITKIGTSRDIVVLGDLNCRTGRASDSKVIGRYGEDVCNDNGWRLINVCDQNNLRILNGFYPHRDIHRYTWTQHTRNLKYIIDYVIVRQRTKMLIKDVKAYRGPSCGSDHYMLKANIVLPNKSQNHAIPAKTDSEPKQIRYKLDSLQHESIRTLFGRRLDQKLERATLTTQKRIISM